MSTIIYIRRTEDWANCTYKTIEADRLLKKIKSWDHTFSVPYFEYRQKIKEITLENFYSITNDVRIEDIGEVSDDDLILATDDDDWFHPEIESYLHFDQFLLWDSLLLDTINGNVKEWYAKRKSVCANNYAIRGEFFNKLDKERQLKMLNWSKTAEWQARKGELQIEKRKDLLLSCHNHHIGAAIPMVESKGWSLPKVPSINEKYSWVQQQTSSFFSLLESLSVRSLL